MSKNSKYNLVLTNSFPTNSLIFKGAIAVLSEYFNVYFIDLPGFIRSVPPLKKITFDAYAKYLEEQIEKLNLDKYILGGVSFSHCIVSRVHTDDRCRAILSLEPYINDDSLLIPKDDIDFDINFLRIAIKLKLYRLLWNKLSLMIFFKSNHKKIIDTILSEIDPRTFFETALLIITNHKACWADKPYILLANKTDDRVCYQDILKQFKANCKELLVVDETIDHFPNDLSKHYFMTHIGKDSIEKTIEWLKNIY